MTKKTLAVFALLGLLLTSCGNSDKIDMEAELNKRPTVTVSWEGVDSASGFTGNFCTEILCLDSGNPDWSAMEFNQYGNGTAMKIQIESPNTISEINMSLKNTELKTLQNNIDYTKDEDGSYAITEPFSQSGELILSIKIKFEEGGYAQSYFPINIQ